MKPTTYVPLCQFRNETGIHIKVHCWNFVGYEAKLLKARSQSTCRPELAKYTGNFYVVGYTFSNEGCNNFVCSRSWPSPCAAFPFSPINAPWDEASAVKFIQHAMCEIQSPRDTL